MAWIILLVMVALIFGGLIWLGKIPRKSWELAGAALLLGVAGYAWQANPSLPGDPREPVETLADADQEQLQKERNAMGSSYGDAQAWMVLADAQSRVGKFATAAGALNKGLESNPENPDLWVALGSALMGHSNGMISPAAQFAFQKAASLDPKHPAPPFFMGLAMATSGRFDDARAIWIELLERSPEGAEWRADLESRIARIDAILAQQGSAPMPGTPVLNEQDTDNQ